MFNYKNLTDSELAEIFNGYQFKIPLKRQQLISLALVLGENLKSIAYWLPVRFGKTITALATAQVWNCNKILVICPNSAFEAWERDIPKISDYTYEFLTGTHDERLAKFNTDKNIYIINYEGLKSIYATLLHGDGWKIDYSSFDNFDCVIFDEVHKCNDYGAIQSDICYELAKRSKYRIGLSADPINKHYLELFNVYKVIDLGKSLGQNFFRFRNLYFKCYNRQGRNTGRKWQEWSIKKEKEQQLLDAISNNSISFERSEVSDVPDNTPIEIEVDPSQEFLDLQTRIIVNDSVELDGKVIDCSTSSIKGQKLLQLSGGFIYYDTDHNNEKGAYLLTHNPKRDKFIELIKQLDAKIIVWHRFIEEAHIIEAALLNNNINFLSIRGGTDTKNLKKKNVVSKFSNDDTKVLLCQTSINEGYDAKAAKYMIFYSQVASPRARNQCEGRIKGDGQVYDYKIYDLIMKQSFDKNIKNSLNKNTTFANEAMAYIRKFNK